MTYRERYRPVIARIIADVGTDDERALRAALRLAFPDPPHDYHPYKIWLDEIRVQLGLKELKTKKKGERKVVAADPNQKDLFT